MSEVNAASLHFIHLEDPWSMDLMRHAFIEASAGTGKTFTIERLVVRAILEQDVDLSRILAVTFTEKATGELKDRIRLFLESLAKNDLRDENDRAWLLAQTQRCGGSEGLQGKVFRCLDRFDESSVFTIHGFCQSVLREYGFDLGHLLDYEVVSDAEILEELLPEQMRRWPSEYRERLEELLIQGEFWKIRPSESGERFRWDTLLHDLALRVGDADELRLPEGAEDGPLHLLKESVEDLRERLSRYKKERGLISYDDMIRRVRDALRDPGRPELVRSLSERYRLAIVDEFQDTDPAQWEIFQRIFLGSASPGSSGRLVLVGDPKQSIYGFRGADVHTYLRARAHFEGLHEVGMACLYRLERNYRSNAGFVTATNLLFSREAWPWSKSREQGGPGQIRFFDSSSAGAWSETAPPSQRGWLNLWESESTTAREAFREFARFIALEILRLKQSGWRLKKGAREDRPFDVGDAAVLTRNGREALLVLAELREAGIPATYYKQAGVFQSKEAFEILYVLEAIADPSRRARVQKALLTRFFGFSLEDIPRLEDLPVDDPVRMRLLDWQDMAASGSWSRLFRSFLAHPDSAVSRLVETDPAGWERTFTNYEQILQNLEEEALRTGLDIAGLIRIFVARIREDGGLAEEDTLHRQETEESRVRVLTMHASKGLEFPVVFVAGGFTEGNSDPYRLFYEGDRRVYGLVPWFGKNRDFKEKDDWSDRNDERAAEEYARLFYVALTRAGVLAYLPFYRPESRRGMGPLGGFVYDAVEEALAIHPDGMRRIGPGPAEGPIDFKKEDPRAKTGALSYPVAGSKAPLREAMLVGASIPPPVVELPANLRTRKADLYSYSSLAARHEAPLRLNTDEKEREDAGISDASKSEGSLPFDRIFRGARAGNLFHEILERLDYQDAAFREEGASPFCRGLSRQNRSTLRNRLRRYGYDVDESGQSVIDEAPEELAAALLFRIMQTELFPGFALRDLDPVDRIHEMEFFFLNDASSGSEDFITGFIDLVFRHEGRTYLLDWKTNRLDDYSDSALDQAVRLMQYDLQYSLYAKALSGWLRSRSPGDRPCGVFYLFLRGMSPGSRDGIYYRDLSEATIEQVIAGEMQR